MQRQRHRPAQPPLENVGWGEPFVFAVVSLHQIVGKLGDIAIARHPARLGGAGERAAEHEIKSPIGQVPSKRLGPSLANLGKRQIGAPWYAVR